MTVNDAYARTDWRLVASVYGQCTAILSDEQAAYLPDVLTGFLAETLGRVAREYHEDEMTLATHTLDVFSTVDQLVGTEVERFQALYFDTRFARFLPYGPPEGRRRRPRPFEATVETCRRLRDITELRGAFRDFRSAAVVGGSTSYGRFFNVSGGSTGSASDIDVLLILEDQLQLPEAVERFRSVMGIDEATVDAMAERASVFLRFRRPEVPQVFSHKLGLWKDAADEHIRRFGMSPAYALSVHAVSLEHFEYLTLRDVPTIGHGGVTTRTVEDYREAAPDRYDHQRSFAGVDRRLDRKDSKVERGFLVQSAVFFIDDRGQYFPGMFQNLVLPGFWVRWDNFGDDQVRARVDSFRWKMIERLREERRSRPHEYLRLSLGHTRSEVFAPYMVRSVDEGLIVP